MYNNLYIYILILIIIAIIVSLGYYLYKNLMSYNTLIHNTINEVNKKLQDTKQKVFKEAE